jgi:hypothetical protein
LCALEIPCGSEPAREGVFSFIDNAEADDLFANRLAPDSICWHYWDGRHTSEARS